MAKKKNARANDEVSGDVNLSPMIDCCFLLLIFFVVNATQITVAKDPSVKIPSAVSCTDLKDAKGCIVINVYADPDKMADKARAKFNKTFGGRADVIWSLADANGKTTGYSVNQQSELVTAITKMKDLYKNSKGEDGKPVKVRAYFRGDQNTPWERTQGAIEAAVKAGIADHVFGTRAAN